MIPGCMAVMPTAAMTPETQAVLANCMTAIQAQLRPRAAGEWGRPRLHSIGISQ